MFRHNPLFIGMRLPEARELEPIEKRFPQLTPSAMDNIKVQTSEIQSILVQT